MTLPSCSLFFPFRVFRVFRGLSLATSPPLSRFLNRPLLMRRSCYFTSSANSVTLYGANASLSVTPWTFDSTIVTFGGLPGSL